MAIFAVFCPDSPVSLESSESFSSMAKKRKRTPWSEAEEKILIDLCKGSRAALKGNGSSQKWNEIARDLSRLSKEVNSCSSFKTGTRCRDKWHNLLNSLKKAKDSSTKTGGDTTKVKSFKHFDQMNSFMADKHEIAMPFVRNSSRDSSTFSGSEQEVSSPLHSEEQENEEDRSEVPKKKGKVRKGKSPKKVEGNLKDDKDECWYALFDKQTKVLEASQKNQENILHFCQSLKPEDVS